MLRYVFLSWLFTFPDQMNFCSIHLFGIHDDVCSFVLSTETMVHVSFDVVCFSSAIFI